MAKAATIKSIISEAKAYLPKLNEERVLSAYRVAEQAHAGQKRSSGEPYIQHPLEVTKILLALHPDEDSIVAALLHDVLEDTPTESAAIEKQFGKNVMILLQGLEKLGKVYYRGAERQVENLRKMFIAMAKDIRVILIKLADRLHNMRTLGYIPEHKRERIARETLTVYAPIAGRLGIYTIKNQLDDLSFEYLHPDDYNRLVKEMDETTGLQQNIIKKSKKILEKVLSENGMEAVIEGRVKHIYSIYKKLQQKNKNYVSELYDVLALRIIVKSEAECYQTLGILHKNWTPLARRFKDYVAVPKANGYQSLHTTLIGLCPKLHNQPIEIQIRTQEMNLVAKYGIAAHWQYKEEKGRSMAVPEDKLNWVQNLVSLHETLKSNEEFIESLNVDVFHDRIFVLTPTGDVLDLPAEATPVDFAYAIHTDVGHHCKGAKVNGQVVPLNSRLKNGAVVEVITHPSVTPNRYWLSFVVTSHAKQRIKAWFGAQDRDHLVKLGRDLLNEQLKRFGEKALDPNLTILRDIDGQKLTIRERESLLEKIGNDSVDVVSTAKKLIAPEKRRQMEDAEKQKRTLLTENVAIDNQSRAEVLITGESGYKTQIASCCEPKPNDPIIGYITRGKGVTIHRQDCKVLRGNEAERLIKVSWSTEKLHEFEATIVIQRRSRIGLLRDVAEIFASNALPIIDIRNVRHENTDIGEMIITASFDRPSTLSYIMDQLRQVPDVFKVEEK